jgi:hypothetical protein
MEQDAHVITWVIWVQNIINDYTNWMYNNP